jgi:hypothetical protein
MKKQSLITAAFTAFCLYATYEATEEFKKSNTTKGISTAMVAAASGIAAALGAPGLNPVKKSPPDVDQPFDHE